MFDLSLMGRLSFTHAAPSKPPLPPGRNRLGIAAERDAVLYVPSRVDPSVATPLMVMFHGAGGNPERVLPFLEEHAEREAFLLLAPHSTFPTWDLVIGGNGPDLEKLNAALAEVAARYRLDPEHLAFAGFSDGGSYALSIGLTNGTLVTHIVAFSAGFMSVFMPEGAPYVFIAHGLLDEQLPIDTSGRANAGKLKAAGYPVEYVEFNGPHAIQKPIVGLAVRYFLGWGEA
ncbi:MAG TPA: esterase [Rhizobacter sp.]|nr:esterase [Rhizobacter sp.]